MRMAQSLEQTSLTHEQLLIAVGKKIPSCRSQKGSHFQYTPKVEHKFSQPFLDPNCEFAQTKGTEQVIQLKSLENNRKSMRGSKVYNDVELVKHMSNVPCFLQQVGKERSIQDKALNFGILDWKRLENWKYNERMPARIHKKTSSSSTGSICMSSGAPKMSPNLRKQPSSPCLSPGSRFSSPHKKPPPSQSSNLNPSKMERKDTCCKEENYYFEGVKQLGNMETLRQEVQVAQRSTIDGHQKFHQKIEFYGSCSEPNLDKVKMNDTKKEDIPERKSRSLEQGKHKYSPSSDDTMKTQGKTSEKSTDDGVNCTPFGFLAELQNFLSTSEDFPRWSCSESSQFSELRMSLDGELVENRFSNCFSTQESGDFSELVIPIPSEGKGLITHEKIAKSSILVEVPERPDAEFIKQPTVRQRHPSPTPRFSFGLGKMSRSSSFKESSEGSQLSSKYTAVRSCPVMKVTTGADSFDKDKANSSSNGRSSPLRRLLDPFLKKKESQSTGIVQPPNGTIVTRGPCQDRKSEGLSSQGLLQLSLKNGLPFFKLVVDNCSSNMLAAVVKKLPSFGKSDHSMVYTFYSVHELRKKNMTWIQGSTSKSCGLGCNILGQMKISSICLPKLCDENSNECAVRECVLYGVDKEQVDKQEPDFLPGTEMAAVVLQNSCQKLDDRELNEDKKLYQDENTNSAVVILPGGVHEIPNSGAPSSLISRWRSGGSCDCGGWDVGCKLRVLTSDNEKGCKILETSMSCSTKDRFNLFVQGRERSSKSAFNLEALNNGFYSMELDSSISLLEAFATGVALLTCQKFYQILDKNSPGHILEAVIGTDKPKTTTTTTTPSQRQVPAKYATGLPPSPVGRI